MNKITILLEDIQKLTGLSSSAIFQAVAKGELDWKLSGTNPWSFTINTDDREDIHFDVADLEEILKMSADKIKKLMDTYQIKSFVGNKGSEFIPLNEFSRLLAHLENGPNFEESV